MLAALARLPVCLYCSAKSMEMAEQYKQTGNLASAASIYRTAAAAPDAPAEASLQLAVIDRKLGNYDEAISTLREADKRHPDNPDVLSQLGYSLLDANK